MLVELSSLERDRLLQLVDAAIAELGPEIHHTRTYKDDLVELRREYRALRDRLAGTSPGATSTQSEHVAADLVGTP